ncbi:MAG TPA: PspA/IM30 family protein [Ktedonobacteraceae bacterium]|jgi:phage shock protein A
MGLLARFTTYLKSLFSAALDRAEDPAITLDYAYQQQIEQLQKLRQAMADVVTNEKRLELQEMQVQRQISRYEDQARQALAANREDLARLALERRQNLQNQMTAFQQQIERLKVEQDKFVQLEQRLSAKVEAFRTQKELVKAQYGAAVAQVKITEAVTGISEEMGDVTLAVERAKGKVLTMQARASALDQLLEQGTLEEVGQLDTGGDALDRQLGQLEDQARVEAHLAALKHEMQLGAGTSTKSTPLLTSGQEAKGA